MPVVLAKVFVVLLPFLILAPALLPLGLVVLFFVFFRIRLDKTPRTNRLIIRFETRRPTRIGARA